MADKMKEALDLLKESVDVQNKLKVIVQTADPTKIGEFDDIMKTAPAPAAAAAAAPAAAAAAPAAAPAPAAGAAAAGAAAAGAAAAPATPAAAPAPAPAAAVGAVATPVVTSESFPMQRVLKSFLRLETGVLSIPAAPSTAQNFAMKQVKEEFKELKKELDGVQWPVKPTNAGITGFELLNTPDTIKAALDTLRSTYLSTPRESASYALRCLLYVDCITDIYNTKVGPGDQYTAIAEVAKELGIEEIPLPQNFKDARAAFIKAFGSADALPADILTKAATAAKDTDIKIIFQEAMEEALQAYQCAITAWNNTRLAPSDTYEYGAAPNAKDIVIGTPIATNELAAKPIAAYILNQIACATYTATKTKPINEIPAAAPYPKGYETAYTDAFSKLKRSGAILNAAGTPAPPARTAFLEQLLTAALLVDLTTSRPTPLDAAAIDAIMVYNPPEQVTALSGGDLHALVSAPIDADKTTVHALHDRLAPLIAKAINLFYRNIPIGTSVLNPGGATNGVFIGGGSFEASQEQEQQEQEQQEQEQQEQEQQEQKEQEGGKKKSKLRRSKKKSKRSE